MSRGQKLLIACNLAIKSANLCALEVRIQKIDLAVSFAYNAFRPGAGGSKREFRTRHPPPQA